MSKYYPLLALLGLLLDILGAFFVSIEAIGIEKILNWKNKFLYRPSILLNRKKTDPELDDVKIEEVLGFPKLLVSLSVGLILLVSTVVVHFIRSNSTNMQIPFSTILIALGITLLFIFFIPSILSYGLRSVAKFIVWTDANYKKGQIGVWGFSLLFVGFSLQFLGGLLQFLKQL